MNGPPTSSRPAQPGEGGRRKRNAKNSTVPRISGVASADACVICAGPTIYRLVTFELEPEFQCHHEECTKCGFVRVLENPWDYAASGFEREDSTIGPRVGTADHRGREFHMAALAVAALQRDDLDVLIVGAGKSEDWRHIAALDEVRSVTTTDLENFCGSPNFVALDERPDDRYDLVIACEVAEHLGDPAADLGAMCRNARRGTGMVVLSTNLYDGTDLARHLYVFIPGHISYYTPESLAVIAAQNDMRIDFRLPKVALGVGGPRKRYVFLAADDPSLERLNEYFAANHLAPSE